MMMVGVIVGAVVAVVLVVGVVVVTAVVVLLMTVRHETNQSALSGDPNSDMSCSSKIAATAARSGVPFRVAGPSSS